MSSSPHLTEDKGIKGPVPGLPQPEVRENHSGPHWQLQECQGLQQPMETIPLSTQVSGPKLGCPTSFLPS